MKPDNSCSSVKSSTGSEVFEGVASQGGKKGNSKTQLKKFKETFLSYSFLPGLCSTDLLPQCELTFE